MSTRWATTATDGCVVALVVPPIPGARWPARISVASVALASVLATAVLATAALVAAVPAHGAPADPDVSELDQQIAAATERLEVLVEQRNAVRDDLAATQARGSNTVARIARDTVRLDELRDRAGAIAAWAYRTGPASQASAVLAAGSPAAVIDQLTALEALGLQARGQLSGLADLLTSLRRERAGLAALIAATAGPGEHPRRAHWPGRTRPCRSPSAAQPNRRGPVPGRRSAAAGGRGCRRRRGRLRLRADRQAVRVRHRRPRLVRLLRPHQGGVGSRWGDPAAQRGPPVRLDGAPDPGRPGARAISSSTTATSIMWPSTSATAWSSTHPTPGSSVRAAGMDMAPIYGYGRP